MCLFVSLFIQEFIVPVEFPNPVLCLHEMASLGELSGLSRKELHHEAWAFSNLTQRILDVSKCKGKAILIYFDGNENVFMDFPPSK